MQNATKKLIASLSVVLMGVGIAGTANAGRWKEYNLMVATYSSDLSVKVEIDTRTSQGQPGGTSGCYELSRKGTNLYNSKYPNLIGRPGWKNMHIKVPTGGPNLQEVFGVEVYTYSGPECHEKDFKRKKRLDIPKNKLANMWLDTRN